MREGVRVRATELQGDRMFGNVKPQVACAIAVQDCAGRDHFRILPLMPGYLPHAVAAMPICPLQLRPAAYAPRACTAVVCFFFGCLFLLFVFFFSSFVCFFSLLFRLSFFTTFFFSF